MAKANYRMFTRSLDGLDRAAELAIRLAEQTGNVTGRVSALCDRLRRAQSTLDAHRKSQSLDRHLARQQGDLILSTLVELLVAVIAEEKSRR